MKTLPFVLLLAIIISSGCKALDKLTQFNIDYDTEFTISAGTIINVPTPINTPDVTTNSEAVFETNDTRADMLEEVRLTEAIVTIKTPAGKNFNFLKSVEIKISADGLPERRVAYLHDHTNDGATSLTLNIDDLDLQEYIKKDQITLVCTVVTDELLTENIVLNVHTEFFVDARILGI